MTRLRRQTLIQLGQLMTLAASSSLSLAEAASPQAPLVGLRRSERMPVLFLGHGSPMNAIEDNPFRRAWQALGQEFGKRYPRPQLILCISAHWLTRGWWLTANPRPVTIHDFGGFPQALFDVDYPAPGAPDFVQGLSGQLRNPAVGLKDDWGFDHGSWSVLQPMFPAADIPLVQLSMDYDAPMARHIEIGRQLRRLRDFGVLIVGSGNIVHNLRALRRDARPDQAYDWTVEFDRLTAEHLKAGRVDALAEFQQLGTVARMAHPTYDHYLPLLYAAGASDARDTVRFFNDSYQAAALAMRSVVWH